MTIPLFDLADTPTDDPTPGTGRPDGTPTGHLPAIGTTRRLRALAYIGQGLDVVTRYGVDLDTLNGLITGRTTTVSSDTAERVKAATADLCWRIGPRDGACPDLARASRRRRWVSIMAWDDIDNPDEKPVTESPDERDAEGNLIDPEDGPRIDATAVALCLSGRAPRRFRKRDRRAVVERLSRHLPSQVIAERLNVGRRLVMRDREWMRENPDWMTEQEREDLSRI